jgi:hypothetical protein
MMFPLAVADLRYRYIATNIKHPGNKFVNLRGPCERQLSVSRMTARDGKAPKAHVVPKSWDLTG